MVQGLTTTSESVEPSSPVTSSCGGGIVGVAFSAVISAPPLIVTVARAGAMLSAVMVAAPAIMTLAGASGTDATPMVTAPANRSRRRSRWFLCVNGGRGRRSGHRHSRGDGGTEPAVMPEVPASVATGTTAPGLGTTEVAIWTLPNPSPMRYFPPVPP